MKVQASKLFRLELELLTLPAMPPGRLAAYTRFNSTDLNRISLYKPAPYLSQHHGHALDLVRLRIQAWTKYIPTHLHFSTRRARDEYMDRHCSYCRQARVLGDGGHIFLTCPATAHLRDELIPQLSRKLRLLDALPWSSLTEDQRVGVMLGNPPPSLLKKNIKSWMSECVPLLHTHTTALCNFLHARRPPSPVQSDDEEPATDDARDDFDRAFDDEVRRAILTHGGNLDGAIARGSGGGSAGGRHLAQAPGQPGAACAPLGEQAPPFAALIRHRTGGGWIFGVFSIRRQSSTERGRGRWESRPRDPGTRTRPRGSPGLDAEVRNSKLFLLHGLASRAARAPI